MYEVAFCMAHKNNGHPIWMAETFDSYSEALAHAKRALVECSWNQQVCIWHKGRLIRFVHIGITYVN
jgi:hypothetical protein